MVVEKRGLGRCLAASALAVSTGCATLMNPSTQPVTVVSDPPAAEVLHGAEAVGRTPTDVRLDRGDGEAALRLQKDGFAPQVVRPRRSLSPWLIGNIAVPALLTVIGGGEKETFLGLAGWGFVIDLFVSGDGFEYPDTVRTRLTPWTDRRSARDGSELDTRFVPDLRLRSAGRVPSEPTATSDDREAAQ